MDKRLNVFQMALRNLAAKKKRTWFMVFFVVLMTATFFSSTILMNNLELGIKNTTERMGADMIVVPREGTEDIRESLFAGEPCSLFFDSKWENVVRDIEGVEKVSAQLYIATLAASCCDAPVQIIAIDPETDFVIKPWLTDESLLDIKAGEIIVGNSVVGKVGQTMKFYGIEFQVAAKLEKTGMGYDNSVFMTFDTVRRLKESQTAVGVLPLEELEDKVSMLMVDVVDEMEGQNLQIIQRNIQQASPKDAKLHACTADELMSGIATQVTKLSGYGNMLTYVMVVAIALALISIFALTINERKYEFGIMYTVGAKKSHIRNIILSEAMVISIAGGMIGIISSYYIVYSLSSIIKMKLDIPFLDIGVQQALPIATTCLVIAILTGIIAALYSANEISKGEAYRLIKEMD